MKKLFYTFSGLIVFCLLGGIVFANTSFFASSASTSTATTTPTYLVSSSAIATTTLPVYDSTESTGTNQVNTGQNWAQDTQSLEIQFTASSTSSVLGWYYEYADGLDGVNCAAVSTNCDWYSDSLVAKSASTTPGTSLTLNNSYTWTFASTTVGGTGATGNRSMKIVTVPTPTRYTRVVFYCTSAATANCAVWARFLPKKQSKS